MLKSSLFLSLSLVLLLIVLLLLALLVLLVQLLGSLSLGLLLRLLLYGSYGYSYYILMVSVSIMIYQSTITSNCQERCGCDFHIGVTITTLKHLCKIEEHPKCDPYSEVIEEHQTPLNDTSFLYTQKKCMAGLILILV